MGLVDMNNYEETVKDFKTAIPSIVEESTQFLNEYDYIIDVLEYILSNGISSDETSIKFQECLSNLDDSLKQVSIYLTILKELSLSLQ